MGKRIIALVVIILIELSNAFAVNAQNPDWLWAKGAGANAADYGRSITTDQLGNLIVAGYFESPSITFGTVTLINSNPGYAEIFLVKYSENGNVLWAKSVSGNGTDNAFSVSTDSHGNIYMAGDFRSSTLSFDTTTLTNAGFLDMFIAKISPAGNVLWAKNANGNYDESAYAVTADSHGIVIVTGYYGPSVTFGSTVLSTAGYEDVFVVKYDSLGNVLWAKSAGGSLLDSPNSICTDTFGNVLVTGAFYSPSMIFNTTTIVNTVANKSDIFLAKYNPNGDLLWARQAGGLNDDVATSVTTDMSGNIVLTGYFLSDTVHFNAATLSPVGMGDMFLVKYDSSGNVIWAKSEGGSNLDAGYAVTTDKQNHIIVAGTFASQTMNIGSDTLVNEGNNDLFIAMYDANGNSYWTQSAGGTYDDIPLSVIADYKGRIVIAGYFFSPGISFGTTTVPHPSSPFFPDMMIAKLDSTSMSTNISEHSLDRLISLFPNPNSGLTKVSFYINKSSASTIEIYSLSGVKLMTFDKGILAKGQYSFTIDTNTLESGLYLIQVKTSDHSIHTKMEVFHP